VLSWSGCWLIVSVLDPILASPYRPAAREKSHIEAGHTSAPDHMLTEGKIMLAFTGASTHVCPRPLFERFDRFRQDLSKQRRHGLMPLGATAKRNNSKVCCSSQKAFRAWGILGSSDADRPNPPNRKNTDP